MRGIVQACADRGLRFITLFAFSTENWQRPPHEASSLLGLLAHYPRAEVNDMTAKGVRLKIVGNISDFEVKIQALIRDAQKKTAHNDIITLTIAANYGGR